MLRCTSGEAVAPVSKPFFPGGDVLGPCSGSRSLWSQGSYSRGKPHAHSSAQWSPAPGDAVVQEHPPRTQEAVQEYLKEEDYS